MKSESSRQKFEHLRQTRKLQKRSLHVRQAFRKWAIGQCLQTDKHYDWYETFQLSQAEQAIVAGDTEFRQYIENDLMIESEAMRRYINHYAYQVAIGEDSRFWDRLSWFLRPQK